MKTNEHKTEIVFVGPGAGRQRLQVIFANLSRLKHKFTNLGVILSYDLNFISHFNMVCNSRIWDVKLGHRGKIQHGGALLLRYTPA